MNNLFTTVSTYTRPGTAYLALWQTLGRDRMINAMKDIQSTYGGKNITEPQLEDVFRSHLAVNSASCNARLDAVLHRSGSTRLPERQREHDREQAEDHRARSDRDGLRLRAGRAGEPERPERLVHERRRP